MSPPPEDCDGRINAAPESSCGGDDSGEHISHAAPRRRQIGDGGSDAEDSSLTTKKPRSRPMPAKRLRTYKPRSAELAARRKKHDGTKAGWCERFFCFICVAAVLIFTSIQIRFVLLKSIFDPGPAPYFKVNWETPVPLANVSILGTTMLQYGSGGGPAESFFEVDEISYVQFGSGLYMLPAAVTIDFSKPEPVCGIAVKPVRDLGSPSIFTVEMSSDTETWTIVERKKFTGPWSDRKSWRLPGNTARYWRFSVEGVFNDTAPAIHYVQLYESLRAAERRFNASLAAIAFREAARSEEL